MKKLIFLLSVFVFLSCSVSEALTGPISIHGLKQGYNCQAYLNENRYQYLGNIMNDGVYKSQDGSMYITTFRNKGEILRIDVVGPGYATNRGIEVGMTIRDLMDAYGNIYPSEGFWKKHNREANAGMIYTIKNSPEYSRSYNHYCNVSFGYWTPPTDPAGQGDGREEVISFIINRYTGRIEMIHYEGSYHRRIDAIKFADEYGLLL